MMIVGILVFSWRQRPLVTYACQARPREKCHVTP
jgi:hypothetical protein